MVVVCFGGSKILVNYFNKNKNEFCKALYELLKDAEKETEKNIIFRKGEKFLNLSPFEISLLLFV